MNANTRSKEILRSVMGTPISREDYEAARALLGGAEPRDQYGYPFDVMMPAWLWGGGPYFVYEPGERAKELLRAVKDTLPEVKGGYKHEGTGL